MTYALNSHIPLFEELWLVSWSRITLSSSLFLFFTEIMYVLHGK